MDPIVSTPLPFEPSTVSFAEHSSAVVVGDKSGNVMFFYLPEKQDEKVEGGGDVLVNIIASATK